MIILSARRHAGNEGPFLYVLEEVGLRPFATGSLSDAVEYLQALGVVDPELVAEQAHQFGTIEILGGT